MIMDETKQVRNHLEDFMAGIDLKKKYLPNWQIIETGRDIL